MIFLNKWMNKFHIKNSQQIQRNLMMKKDSLLMILYTKNINIHKSLYIFFKQEVHEQKKLLLWCVSYETC
jgi:hypothetical protein